MRARRTDRECGLGVDPHERRVCQARVERPIDRRQTGFKSLPVLLLVALLLVALLLVALLLVAVGRRLDHRRRSGMGLARPEDSGQPA